METKAKHCNDKKDNSKKAQTLSTDMFFVAFLKVSDREMGLGYLTNLNELLA